MEKGVNAYIQEKFDIDGTDLRAYSPLTLAYIGDAVFELVIRSVVVGHGNTKVGRMNQRTSHIVKASTQAKMIEALLPSLTDEERDIYRRGRNANSPTMSKNATMSDYRKATGLEALVGYLYLDDQFDRILFLTRRGLEELNERI